MPETLSKGQENSKYEGLVAIMKDKQLILNEQLQNLNQNFGDVAQHLFENYATNVKKSNPHASH